MPEVTRFSLDAVDIQLAQIRRAADNVPHACVVAIDRETALHIYEQYILSGLPMKTAKLFRNGDSQAVRLPKEFRFDGTEVLIKRVGNAVVLLPRTHSWDSLIASLEKFPNDFMAERGQPEAAEARESLR